MISSKAKLLISIIFFLGVGCQKFSADVAGVIEQSSMNDQDEDVVPVNPVITPTTILTKNPDVRPLWETKNKDGSKWTQHILKELPVIGFDLLDVIPADKDLFCPNYINLNIEERKYFWAFLISSMVRFESGFNPNTFYKESFNDNNGNPVISRGLLQISIESSRGYNCGFTSENELHDPYKNLSCGVRILNRWLARDGRMAGKVGTSWQGGARYWSVLRAGDKESYNSIVKWAQNLSFCQL